MMKWYLVGREVRLKVEFLRYFMLVSTHLSMTSASVLHSWDLSAAWTTVFLLVTQSLPLPSAWLLQGGTEKGFWKNTEPVLNGFWKLGTSKWSAMGTQGSSLLIVVKVRMRSKIYRNYSLIRGQGECGWGQNCRHWVVAWDGEGGILGVGVKLMIFHETMRLGTAHYLGREAWLSPGNLTMIFLPFCFKSRSNKVSDPSLIPSWIKKLSVWHPQSTVKRVKQVEWQQNARRRAD